MPPNTCCIAVNSYWARFLLEGMPTPFAGDDGGAPLPCCLLCRADEDVVEQRALNMANLGKDIERGKKSGKESAYEKVGGQAGGMTPSRQFLVACCGSQQCACFCCCTLVQTCFLSVASISFMARLAFRFACHVARYAPEGVTGLFIYRNYYLTILKWGCGC